jgi:hypothetical protein
MAKQWAGAVLVIVSLIVLAAAGNLAGLAVVLLPATLAGWAVVQFGKSKEPSSLRESAKKR